MKHLVSSFLLLVAITTGIKAQKKQNISRQLDSLERMFWRYEKLSIGYGFLIHNVRGTWDVRPDGKEKDTELLKYSAAIKHYDKLIQEVLKDMDSINDLLKPLPFQTKYPQNKSYISIIDSITHLIPLDKRFK